MRLTSVTILAAALFLCDFNSSAQRVPDAVDNQPAVTLAGNRPPLARAEYDAGPAAPDYRMSRMILTLLPTAEQQSALAELLDAQQDPSSPSYHQWLTPQQFEEQFGVSEPDANRVAEWLTSQGFSIDEIPAGRRSIVFSGTAAQVAAAFHTEIRTYNIHGELHHANATDPQIPQALASVVAGTVSLHDFRRAPMHANLHAAPQYTSGGSHYLAPADFAAIYDVAPLYLNSINGAGQTIAIVGRTNIRVTDVQAFRSTFGLATNNPTVVVNGADPGIISTDEEAEADLDVEWSGAVAPQATVKFVVSASTSSTDGVDLSAQYIVSNNLAAVMSTSFGSCEAALGLAERTFYSNLWQQAAAQGITTLIAAGDSGAAGCYGGSSSSGAGGLGVNGLCSSSYSVCVGGTEFNEGGNTTLYWSATNNSSTFASALSYIPEVAWNESGLEAGGSGLWATGGGASLYYAKPSWQTGTGVPADGKRDVPDVSLSTAGHDGYLVDILGSFYIISGTSAASPSMAGLMALVDQKTSARQGNANAIFYPLATLASAGGAAVFHGTTGGNNSVPGLAGFIAGPHYNEATGLGSPDAFVLVNHWTDSHASPAFSITTASSGASISRGAQASVTAAVAVTGGFSGAVALSVAGLPSGVTASFTPATLAAPGSGTSTLTLTASASATVGSATLTISAVSGSTTKTAQLTLTVAAPVFNLTESASALSLPAAHSGTITLTTAAGAGFNSAVALTASGLPTGVTASFSIATIPAPGSGSSVLTLTAASTTASGTHSITITATGGGATEQVSLSVTVVAPVFTLSENASALSVVVGHSGTVTLTTAAGSGFNSSLQLTAAGLPAGVSASLSNSTISAPGSGSSVLTLTAASTATPGTHTITITASGGGASEQVSLSLAIVAPSFTLGSASSNLSLAPGGSGQVQLSINALAGFSGAVTFSTSALPSGVSAKFAAAVMTLTVSGGAAPGNFPITIVGASPGVSPSPSTVVTLTVGYFTLTSTSPTASVARGSSTTVTLHTAVEYSFNAPLTISAQGLPAGVTATFSPSTVSSPASGMVTMTITAASSAAVAARTIDVVAASGGVSVIQPISLTVH